MTAIAALSLMTYLAMEVTYDTQVEYLINAQQINRVKAYYAARSGVDLSLLRVKIFQTVQQKLGKNLPANGMIDQIWQFPLIWPLELPDGLNAVDKDQIKDKTKESLLDAAFATKITDEGSKIDITNLASPSETLREITKKQLIALFENKIKDDEEFSKNYNGYRFDTLVNNIADWMSSKNESLNGGDKKSGYRDRGTDTFPPNRNFRTIQEIRLVTGMTDEFYQILEPQVTIYGVKGLNPNTATSAVLQSIDPTITKEIAAEVIKRRTDEQLGPFKDAASFWQFLEEKGARLSINKEEFPINTDSYSSFRINVIGEYGGSKREVDVITLDMNKVAEAINEVQKKVDEKNGPAGGGQTTSPPAGTPGGTPNPAGNTGQTAASQPPGKGPPRIVYWNEK
ncbi:MAG: general secretion pathway protein GspK [Bdellovibrionaceae bacterium]|nr:general secretion pathway protein GspK [Pseudobdellovibrionaceae bacterium]